MGAQGKQRTIESLSLVPDRFFQRTSEDVAGDLLGKYLVRTLPEGNLIARIVETEAYLPNNDAACHAATKMTPRNQVMFERGGMIYVYSIHNCFCVNIVSGNAGEGCAVLIRAAEPIDGLDLMKQNRATDDVYNLLSGPGKLCKAFQIDRGLNGSPLARRSGFWIGDPGEPLGSDQIRRTPRIGVTAAKELPLRFVIAGSVFASGPKSMRL